MELNREQQKALDEGFCPICFDALTRAEKEVKVCTTCGNSWYDD